MLGKRKKEGENGIESSFETIKIDLFNNYRSLESRINLYSTTSYDKRWRNADLDLVFLESVIYLCNFEAETKVIVNGFLERIHICCAGEETLEPHVNNNW